MKIFIAGGAGFIGSHIADRMLELGDEVMVFDNFSSGCKENNLPHKNLTVVKGDIKDNYAIHTNMKLFKPDVVIHAAVEPVLKNIEKFEVATNIIGTLNLLESSKIYEIKRFIYFQTVLIYGAVNEMGNLPITHPVNPQCSYAITKLAAEQYIRNSGHDFISFRLANIFGPRNLTGAFPVFYKKLKAGEKCFISDERRTFVYIDDLVNLVEKACDLKYPSGIYHVSNEFDMSIKDIFMHIYSEMHNSEYNPDSNEHEFVKADKSAMKVMRLDWLETLLKFNWRPYCSLLEGIKKTISWYDKNGVKKTYTHFQNEKS